MDLPVYRFPLRLSGRLGRFRIRIDSSFFHPQLAGERGEIVLDLVLLLTSAGLLYGGLFWLNKTFEMRTKEHLYDFETRWNHLEQKYKD